MRLRLVILIGLIGFIVVVMLAIRTCASGSARKQVAGSQPSPVAASTVAGLAAVASGVGAAVPQGDLAPRTDHDRALAAMESGGYRAAVLDGDLLAKELRSLAGVSMANVRCAASACRLRGNIAIGEADRLDQRLDAIRARYESTVGSGIRLMRSDTVYVVRGSDPVAVEFSGIIFVAS